MKRGWEGIVLKAFRGRDFRLTVIGTERVSERYHRIDVEDGGLIAACGLHPTMWIRLWFDNDGAPHQRAYTLVDPDPPAGRFSLEFALHDGCAARWALAASAGDTIDATVQGSRFALPEPAPRRVYAVGDLASLPAVNSLLETMDTAPATVWLEYTHESDRTLPVRAAAGHTVTWVPRRDGGRHLVDTVCSQLDADATDPRADYYWVACEADSTRSIAGHLRRTLQVDKRRMLALGYWRAT